MKAMIYGAGGGTSSDEVTALKKHVLSPYTTITNDSGDEIVAGTMIDNGAVNRSLKCGESYTIEEGFHNGSGVISADSLASQTGANAAAGDILTGKTAWVNGIKLTGTLPTMAGGTKTPSTSQITVACSGYKMTSNIVIPAFSLPSASIILSGKKVTIYGKSVTGTAQQFIKTGTEIKTSIFSIMSGYFYKDSSVFELGADSASNTPYARSNSAFNLTNYRYVKIPSRTTAGSVRVGVSSNSNGSGIRWGGWLSTGGTPIVDVSDLSGMYFIYAQGTGNGSVTSSFKVGDSYYSKYYYSFATGTISNS